jgi:hypothetical protein
VIKLTRVLFRNYFVLILLFCLNCTDEDITGAGLSEGDDTRLIQGNDVLEVGAHDLLNDALNSEVLSGDVARTDSEEEPVGPFPDDTFSIADLDAGAGLACGEDAGTCVEPYVCMEGVCTLDISGLTYVEQSYEVEEPEELRHVFNFVKTFAADVAFLMLEISGDEGDPWRRPARYGTADRILLPDSFDVVYQWQFETEDRVLFEPVRGPNGLWGNVWESNIFQWNLEAHIVVEELYVDTVFGFIAESTQVYLEFSDDLSVGEGTFSGIITREEAENRIFGDTEFEPFRDIVCLVQPELLPLGEDWSLADILDCNATPMDVDFNADGVMDGYFTSMNIRIEPANIYQDEAAD